MEITIANILVGIAKCIEEKPGSCNASTIAKDLRTIADGIRSGEWTDTIEKAHPSYEEQLRHCANHGLICLEYYRRHRGDSRLTMAGPRLPGGKRGNQGRAKLAAAKAERERKESQEM